MAFPHSILSACVKSDNNYVFESVLKINASAEKNWNCSWTFPRSENKTEAEVTDVWCFYKVFFVFIVADSSVSLGRSFWPITGHSAGQTGSWLLHRCPKQLLPWPPSNPDKLLLKTASGMAMGKFPHSKGGFTHPYCPVFTHFPQSGPGWQPRESVCPWCLPPHHRSVPQRLYSLLWSKAWKSINKREKDKWRSKATRAMKIRSSNDAYLPLTSVMVTNHLKNQLTFQQVQG